MTRPRNLSRSARGARAGGFTLLELLLASAIMAVLAAAVYSAMRIGFKARDRALAAMGPARSAEIAMGIIRRDLESALPPKGLFAGAFLGRLGTETPDTGAVEFYALGRRPEITATAESRARAANGASTIDRQDTTAYGGMQRVDLLVAPSSYGADAVLVRRVTRNLLAPTEPVPDEEVICRGIVAFTLRYYDGYQWANEWDSTQYGDVLPLAVEVSLTLAGPRDPTTPLTPAGVTPGNREQYHTTRTFLLPCRDETALTQGVTQ